ncbi:MAG: hypothetical protein O3A63_07060 [Proteobacteria bacterium]|nr:hypothetical protein [Pseudomonadota bacterium]
MLHRVDRIQMSTHNAQATARRWCEVLDCAVVDEDRIQALNAQRITVSIGDSLVEILQPLGPGLVQDHLDTGRGGPFSVGVTTDDLDRLRQHLSSQGIDGVDIGDQLFLHESVLSIPGLTVLVSRHTDRDRVGLMKNLYEATHLTGEATAAIASIAKVFALDASAFVPIRSETFGYDGSLTLFDASELHRFETIDPFDRSKTMGRFFNRFGPSLYMCYGETDQLPAIRERLKSIAPDGWTGSDDDNDGLFVHPKVLGGVMLGISRTTHAWTWSGYPERRLPLTAG